LICNMDHISMFQAYFSNSICVSSH
jgi:hypothetical protein